MKMIYLLLIFILCSATLAQENLNDADLTQYVNKQVRYCDYVYGAHVTKGEKPVILLNLGADFPDAKLVVAIFNDDWKNFSYKPEEFLLEKQICVKGKLVLYKGKPEIIIKGPKQIEMKE